MEERRDREIKLREKERHKKKGTRQKINACPFSSYLD
jgi:hypothetical protein